MRLGGFTHLFIPFSSGVLQDIFDQLLFTKLAFGSAASKVLIPSVAKLGGDGADSSRFVISQQSQLLSLFRRSTAFVCVPSF